MEFAGLIEEIKSGNESAQDALFKKLSGRMFIVCRRYIKNTEDAEERMLDGFCNVFLNIGSFEYKADAAFLNWMKQIMIHACMRQLRKKNTVSILPETAAGDVPMQDDIVNKLSASEIYKLIMVLPEGYRTVFNLYVIDGFDHNEIGRLLNISANTSRTQLLQARKLLQKKLNSNKHNHEPALSK
ncbi:MAG: sigma-70 family RNA polymerase sigma factor [Ferruginibacter sp.]